MPLVERLADRVFVMAHGRELLQGTVPEIRAQWGCIGGDDAASLHDIYIAAVGAAAPLEAA
jgi:ABC-type multidrug transport system ATPase subunit